MGGEKFYESAAQPRAGLQTLGAVGWGVELGVERGGWVGVTIASRWPGVPLEGQALEGWGGSSRRGRGAAAPT